MLKDGLYEQIINKSLDAELSTTDKLSQTTPIDSAEASKVLAKYVAEVVEKGLDNLVDNGGDVNAQVNCFVRFSILVLPITSILIISNGLLAAMIKANCLEFIRSAVCWQIVVQIL